MSTRSIDVIARGSRWIGLSALVLACTGCASITSYHAPKNAAQSRGMVYRLPLKHVLVKLTVSDGERSVVVEPTVAFGDRSTLYVARVNRSWIANNNLTISVDANGLLQSDQSFATESKLSEGLAQLASVAGRLSSPPSAAKADGAPPIAGASPCEDDGTYTWALDPSSLAGKTWSECAIRVSIAPVLTDGNNKTVNVGIGEGKGASGLFYRQALPYHVVFTDSSKGLTQSTLFFLPTSDSPVGFLPIGKTLFAKNTTTATFSDGMPTKFGVDQDSEWLAVASLPATILTAYIDGIKKSLTDRTATLDEQVKYLNALSKATAQESKTAACLEELAKPAPDSAVVQSLCGSAP